MYTIRLCPQQSIECMKNSGPDILTLRRKLRTFYRKHARDLPWRRDQDPYRVWISEIMCQQTQVETVRPRFIEFIRQFPSVRHLASANVSEVCEAWAGLGYYTRARNLHRAATIIIKNGNVPTSFQTLLSLPGIGRYTAGAIASICAHAPTPVVDGNVIRVYTRLMAHEELSNSSTLRNDVWAWATEYARGKSPGELNQAIMEFGALVCTPKAPRCGECTLKKSCRAFAQGRVEKYPRRPPKKTRPLLHIAFALVETESGLWLQQRPTEGLWAGLWEPPSSMGPNCKTDLQTQIGPKLKSPVAQVEHLLTHRRVVADIYRVQPQPRLLAKLQKNGGRFFSAPQSAPLSSLARKVLEHAQLPYARAKQAKDISLI